MMFCNHNVAFESFKHTLFQRGYKIHSISPKNKGRHLLIDSICEDKHFFYYLVYKHAPFHSFEFEFKDFILRYPAFKGYGESINLEYLYLAKQKDATIIYIYESGEVYGINASFLYKFVHDHSLIRVQNIRNEYLAAYSNGVKEVVNEQTASFPMILLWIF